MLDLWVISFHAVVVFGLGKNFLLKFIPRRCVHGLRTLDTVQDFFDLVGHQITYASMGKKHFFHKILSSSDLLKL